MPPEQDQEAADHDAMLAEMAKRREEQEKIRAAQDAALEKVRQECAAARSGGTVDPEV